MWPTLLAAPSRRSWKTSPCNKEGRGINGKMMISFPEHIFTMRCRTRSMTSTNTMSPLGYCRKAWRMTSINRGSWVKDVHTNFLNSSLSMLSLFLVIFKTSYKVFVNLPSFIIHINTLLLCGIP